MKKIVSIIVIIFLSIGVKAQPPHPSGSTTYHPELTEFVGTWRWTSGTDTLIVVLQKQLVYFPHVMNYHEECLIGWHKYVKNGVVIESDLQSVGNQWTFGKIWESQASLFGASNQAHKVYFTTFKDYTIHKKGEVLFSLVSGSTTQATWELKNTRGLKAGDFNMNFTLPRNIILTKQ